jgi:hypothetical protein
VYYPLSQEDEAHVDARNKVEGDTIYISFQEEEIERVTIIGNVTGSYSFRESESTGN